jgi:large subunit ribosomal protein L25
VLDLNVDGKVQKVLVRDWQKHPFKQQMLHMDFLRINENEAIRVNVPIHFLNQEKSMAGKTAGVVISHNLNEVEVSCLPKDLPEFLELDLSDLKPGDIVHLSQIKLPANVEIASLHLGADHDVAVVTAVTVQEEVDAAPAAEGAAEGDAKPAAGDAAKK